jgi:glycosyltransferase involved in cell wall biosynthesis
VRITFVLWRGDIGGAERVTVALAGELRRMSVDADILFVCEADRLGRQMAAEAVPYAELGYDRGSRIVAHPLRLRRMLRRLRPDVVIPVAVGYLGAAVRAAGFRGPLVGVEHGVLIEISKEPRRAHVKGWADRLIGLGVYDAEVAISEYMRELISRGPHARRVVLIPHGVEAPVESPLEPAGGGELIAGFAGRLHPGKGADRLIRAVAALTAGGSGARVRARIAGDGEMRAQWQRLARELGVEDRVEFLGWSDDIAGLWAGCHLAVAPNDVFIESFGMSVLEAMAAGRPAIVTDRGALPELVLPGLTGQVVPAGDDRALARALAGYAVDREALRAHGAAAHRRAVSDYTLRRSASRYLELADELLERSRRRRRGYRARP